MQTIFKKTDIENIDMDVIKLASNILKKGEMVAFPTETVYGLGADALDEAASKKIYEAKGRPSDNPLIVHVANISQVERLTDYIPDTAKKLMEAFWPGPLTIVFKKSKIVPDGTTGGLDTVAVRMPNHKVALKLIEYSDVMIAAPSANTSGRPSPTLAEHVMDDLNGKISMVIDGGKVGIGIESTIVDVTEEIPMILRPGFISKKMLEEVVGKVEIDKAILGPISEEIKPKAPGMKYRHYAPKAEFVMYRGSKENVSRIINEETKKFIEEGKKVGVIVSEETRELYEYGDVVVIGSRQDAITISRNLYGVLRDFDDKNVDVILGETYDDDGLGVAIMNRMLKAAGYRVLEV